MTARPHYDPDAGPWVAYRELAPELVARRKCSACGSWCSWADDAWVCDRARCGSEWYPDHDPRTYAPPGDAEADKPRRDYVWAIGSGDNPVRTWSSSPGDCVRFDTRAEALAVIRAGRGRVRGITTGAERVRSAA